MTSNFVLSLRHGRKGTPTRTPVVVPTTQSDDRIDAIASDIKQMLGPGSFHRKELAELKETIRLQQLQLFAVETLLKKATAPKPKPKKVLPTVENPMYLASVAQRWYFMCKSIEHFHMDHAAKKFGNVMAMVAIFTAPKQQAANKDKILGHSLHIERELAAFWRELQHAYNTYGVRTPQEAKSFYRLLLMVEQDMFGGYSHMFAGWNGAESPSIINLYGACEHIAAGQFKYAAVKSLSQGYLMACVGNTHVDWGALFGKSAVVPTAKPMCSQLGMAQGAKSLEAAQRSTAKAVKALAGSPS